MRWGCGCEQLPDMALGREGAGQQSWLQARWWLAKEQGGAVRHGTASPAFFGAFFGGCGLHVLWSCVTALSPAGIARTLPCLAG